MPAFHAAYGHRLLALGLHLVGHEATVVLVGRATPSAASPSTSSHAPGRGLPARTTGQLGGGAARVELELVDGELLGVRRLARLRLGLDRVDRRERRDQQLGAASRRAARAARPRSRRRRSATTRDANTGPVSRPASTPSRDAGLGVAREDRPLDRRRAAPARQQREVHVHEARAATPRAARSAAAGRTRRRRRARRRCRGPASTTSRARSGVATVDAVRRPRRASPGSGRSPPPRPRRRSGWVTTSGMSWPAASSASNGTTASRGAEEDELTRTQAGRALSRGTARAAGAVTGGGRRRRSSRVAESTSRSSSAFLRSSGSRRSSMRMPSRWSISCRNTRPE